MTAAGLFTAVAVAACSMIFYCADVLRRELRAARTLRRQLEIARRHRRYRADGALDWTLHRQSEYKLAQRLYREGAGLPPWDRVDPWEADTAEHSVKVA